MTRDLWDALSGAIRGEVDIAAMMDAWTQYMGFPIITLEEAKGDRKKRQASTRWSDLTRFHVE